MSKTIEHIVMSRVRRIYLMRKFFAPTALKVYGLAVCTLALFSAVSVAHVLANMPAITAPIALGGFFVNALTHTELMVQALLVGVGCVTVLLLRDVVRMSLGRQSHSLVYL